MLHKPEAIKKCTAVNIPAIFFYKLQVFFICLENDRCCSSDIRHKVILSNKLKSFKNLKYFWLHKHDQHWHNNSNLQYLLSFRDISGTPQQWGTFLECTALTRRVFLINGKELPLFSRGLRSADKLNTSKVKHEHIYMANSTISSV